MGYSLNIRPHVDQPHLIVIELKSDDNLCGPDKDGVIDSMVTNKEPTFITPAVNELLKRNKLSLQECIGD